jgi:acetamidase/formamidase
MGVAPPEPSGRISSAPPWVHAGNLDNKELVAGSILYIPVHVRGALFHVGDGHAGQGNGEVDITALETSLEGTLQLVVRKDMRLRWPRAETPTVARRLGNDGITECARIVSPFRQTILGTRAGEILCTRRCDRSSDGSGGGRSFLNGGSWFYYR